MPLFGTLSTMSLPDLLQWLGSACKTGTLQVEHDRATKVVRLRDGRVIGCCSDEPGLRLGQLLLSRKQITEQQLREARVAQEKNPGFLGQALVEAGAIDAEALRQALEAKAEEVIFSLFDWPDGVFRFEETIDEQKDVFPIELRVEEILLCGMQRYDELKSIREVLHDPGIILRYTSKPPGPEIFGDETKRLMYASIDGQRTLSEILLHVHGSEYQVKRFLFRLHQDGYVEKVGVRRSDSEKNEADVPDLTPLENLDRDLVLKPATAMKTDGPSGSLAAELARAGELMSGGDLENALDVLNALHRENPGDDALRRLTAEAEAAVVDHAYRETLPERDIPILLRSVEDLASETLTPQECFLLSRIDGNWDVKSIVQVAPFGESEALRTLKRMREMGIIELVEPEQEPQP